MFENKDYKDILQDNSNEQIVSCPEDMCINEKSSFVTHVDLQDLINYQGYEYQIVSGIYFEGRNYTIQHVIASTFQKRLKYKEEKNPM